MTAQPTTTDRANVIIIGPGPNCAEFAAAWQAEIIRRQAGALAAHIRDCAVCKKWDAEMRGDNQ
jgi:hypothetical protein